MSVAELARTQIAIIDGHQDLSPAILRGRQECVSEKAYERPEGLSSPLLSFPAYCRGAVLVLELVLVFALPLALVPLLLPDGAVTDVLLLPEPVVERLGLVPIRMFMLVDGSRLIVVVRLRVSVPTITDGFRLRTIVVVRLDGDVAITRVRFFLATFFFFLITVTRDGRSSVVTTWRVRERLNTTSGLLLRSRTTVRLEEPVPMVARTLAPPLVLADGAPCDWD
jgi:hypothetical protein